MKRILHLASLRETLTLFCEPLRSRALQAGYEFTYLDGRQFGARQALMRRGYAAILSWPHASEIRARILEHSPNIVHVHTPATALALLPVLRKLDVPLVYVARGGFDEGRRPAEQAIFRRVDPLFWEFWDCVAVINRTQLRAAREATEVPVRLVSAGGLPAPPVQELPSEAKPSRILNLLWVGRLTPDKQPSAAWRVAVSLHEAGHPVQITFVGAALEGDRTASDLPLERPGGPVAHFTGWVKDVAPWYRGADVLLVTSRREGYGRTPLEAAAFGVPTVAYTTQGTSDSVPSVHGWLVGQGDEEGLVRCILEYWTCSEAAKRHHRQVVLEAASRMEAIDVWAEWRAIYDSLL